MGHLTRGLLLPGAKGEADSLEGAGDPSIQRNMSSTSQDNNLC